MSTLELYRDFCSPTPSDYSRGKECVFLTSVRAQGIMDGWDEKGVEYFSQSGHRLAAEAHFYQTRFGGRPYITHPEGGTFILQNEIYVPQGKSLTPSDGVRILNHDIAEDCPDFLERLYKEVTPEEFASIIHISKINAPLWAFLIHHTTSRVGQVLYTNYLHRLALMPNILFRESSFWRVFQDKHSYIHWDKFNLSHEKDRVKLMYGIAILTNHPEDNTFKTADAVYNLRDSDYLKTATVKKRKSRKEKIQFLRDFLLGRLLEEGNEVEYRLLRDALEYAEDHLHSLENPTVSVPASTGGVQTPGTDPQS